jgi:hypothetical protein
MRGRQVERPEVRTRKVALSRGPRGDWRAANRERLEVSLATEDATRRRRAQSCLLERRDCNATIRVYLYEETSNKNCVMKDRLLSIIEETREKEPDRDSHTLALHVCTTRVYVNY